MNREVLRHQLRLSTFGCCWWTDRTGVRNDGHQLRTLMSQCGESSALRSTTSILSTEPAALASSKRGNMRYTAEAGHFAGNIDNESSCPGGHRGTSGPRFSSPNRDDDQECRWSGRRESNPRSQLGNQERAYPGELQHGKSPAQRSECPSVNETEWQRPREERAMATCQQSWTVARPLARRSRASRAEAIFVWAGRLCGQEEGRLRVLRRSGPPAIDAKHLLREAGMREPTRDHS